MSSSWACRIWSCKMTGETAPTTSKGSPSSIESQKKSKNSYFPLYWLFYRGPYNSLLQSLYNPTNQLVFSRISPWGTRPRNRSFRHRVKHRKSRNLGKPPKSSILIRFSIINHPFWGTPIFGNTHIIIFLGWYYWWQPEIRRSSPGMVLKPCK